MVRKKVRGRVFRQEAQGVGCKSQGWTWQRGVATHGRSDGQKQHQDADETGLETWSPSRQRPGPASEVSGLVWRTDQHRSRESLGPGVRSLGFRGPRVRGPGVASPGAPRSRGPGPGCSELSGYSAFRGFAVSGVRCFATFGFPIVGVPRVRGCGVMGGWWGISGFCGFFGLLRCPGRFPDVGVSGCQDVALFGVLGVCGVCGLAGFRVWRRPGFSGECPQCGPSAGARVGVEVVGLTGGARGVHGAVARVRPLVRSVVAGFVACRRPGEGLRVCLPWGSLGLGAEAVRIWVEMGAVVLGLS